MVYTGCVTLWEKGRPERLFLPPLSRFTVGLGISRPFTRFTVGLEKRFKPVYTHPGRLEREHYSLFYPPWEAIREG